MSLSTKSEIRSFYKELRQKLPPELKAEMDEKIARSFLSLDIYKDSGILLAFISKGIEVSTDGIISQAIADGKNVAVPKCDSRKHEMRFYVIESRNDLENGYFDIPVPKAYCRELTDFNNSVCIVPGLAYDTRCFRTGFGGGYYDRFLSEYKGVSIGLCYSNCIEQRLPVDDYDRPVDILITDTKIFRKDNGYG